MINFEKYGINYDPKYDYNIIPCDLIAIGNVDRNIVETKVLEDNDTTITIKGEYDIKNKDAVVRGEIIKVVSSTKSEGNTILNVQRGLSGTLKQDCVGYNFRTVVLLDEKNTEIDLIEWSFEDTTGSVSNNLFPVELGSGSVLMKSNLSLWSPTSISQKFRVRNRKTVVYIFKGVMGKRFLKFTTVVTKLGVNTRSKNDPNRIKLDIKTRLATWYDKDLSVNSQLKGTTPKEFFKILFKLNDDEVYYANGVNENSFLKINNLHTKEYKKMSEILKAYCSNGVRFCFDKYERVKIFSDFVVDNIQSQKMIFEDLTESTITENESMIYNTISTQAIQRLTMYNFEDLQNKYVMFAKVLRDAIRSDKFMSVSEESGDYVINGLEIANEDLHSSCQLGDIVCFKRTVEPYYEYYGRVKDIDSKNIVRIMPILYDKDNKLFYFGKDEYLYSILHGQSCPMDLYYVRQELPIVFKYTRNRDNEEIDAYLEYPILPKVDGKTLYPVETNITFGCASNLKIGKYTGIIEEVDKIYGSWDNKTLLYNREIDQFSNTNYPPIFALTNKMEEKVIGTGKFIKKYTSFDNSNFVLDIEQPKDNKSDATITMYNNMTVNSDIDLVVDEEIERMGNRILRVRELSKYKIGDVLILNKKDDFTEKEELEYNDTFVNIRWTVVHKSMQLTESGYKNYIELDSDFPKRTGGKVHSFTRFPNWSIVYLQELYFRGNPVIEFTQDITGIAKGVNYEGDRSIDIYGEKKYDFDSKQLDKDNMKMMMGYILDHFQAVNLQSTKFNVPISTFNGIDIELLDVITVKDPSHTQIDERNKWVVVSVTNKAKTNIVELKLLNINTTNTTPFKLDVKDVLEYKPVEIPTYDHNGNEGNGGGDNDGNGGDGVDKSIGVFKMSEVDPKLFRAKVEKFDGNYIYFKSFGGTEWEAYTGKLFPASEFGVSINGETILVQSDMNYRAFVKKRDIYNVGEQQVISEDMDVKFLVMISFTDVDGKFYSRKCLIGDGDTYFLFDPITGAKFVGDFVIGENNQHAGNDLWESLQKNRTFHQNTPPISDSSYTIRVGDIWYDIDDENHVYRWNGDAWRSCRDNSIISTQSSSFVQDEPPQATAGRPINNGDTWYDSNDGYKPYVYKDGEWINVTDRTLEGAIEEAKRQADNANNKLIEIASDDKLTESEKQSTKKDWDIIVGEYPKIIEEATKFGVDRTRYTHAYDTLNSYLTPLLANLNVTSDISGNTFRENFKNYYDNRQLVLNGISSKVVAINSMQNGKMLYLDPTFKNGHNGISVYDNNGSGLITHSIMTGEDFGVKPTNDSNKVLVIDKKEGATNPSMGGFFFGVQTRAGMKVLTKIVAYIPQGFKINWASNATGSNGKQYWVTEQDGTGQFQEYVHVTECGTDGDFSSTAFFYLTSNDGNNTKPVIWGLSYATVFDAGANQNDYVTEALGNAKIFYSPTAPISGMKTNDLWYDTDDGNHPYIYNGSIWISARDKIFETEGGNKVYFQAHQPPTSGSGIKNGDMWFKTDENNKVFVLTDGTWVLANDAVDSINNGRVVINANTVFNGDATVVSRGTDESTIIKGGSITFTRGGQQITVIRNMRTGVIATDGNGSGYVDFVGMKNNLIVLPSIKAFDVSANVRSLNCRAEKDPNFIAQNRYKFYVYGTEEVVTNTQVVESPSASWSINAYTAGAVSITLKTTQTSVGYNTGYLGEDSGGMKNLTLSWDSQMVLGIKTYIDSSYYGEIEYLVPNSCISSYFKENGHYYILTAVVTLNPTEIAVHGVTKTTIDKTDKNVRYEYYIKNYGIIRSSYTTDMNKHRSYTSTVLQDSIRLDFVKGKYQYAPTYIQNIVGGGEVHYLAIEQ